MSRARWQTYLRETSTYGRYEDRVPEYRIVAQALFNMGLGDDMLVVDVGAGTCDFDAYLRTAERWRGQYLPVDGAIDGTNLEGWEPWLGLEPDYVVCIETIEHVLNPTRLLNAILGMPARGFVITTPNADVVDVLAVDPTHRSALTKAWFEEHGFTARDSTLNPGRGRGDTIVATLSRPLVSDNEEAEIEAALRRERAL